MFGRFYQGHKRRGSVLLALMFMVICSFLAFAFATLLPTEARATIDAQRRQSGSLGAEAGVIEAIAFLENGGNINDHGPGSPLVSTPGDFPDYWTYEVIMEDNADDPTLPQRVVRVTSEAKQFGNTYLVARAYLRWEEDVFFVDMMRVQGEAMTVAGMFAEYFDPIHTNGRFKTNYDGGYAAGSTFHDKVTWSDPAQTTGPEISGLKGQTKWTKVHSDCPDDSSYSPGFEGPVDERELPKLDPADPDGLFNTSNPDSFYNKTLAGGVPPGNGVQAYTDGGIFVEEDDDLSIRMALLSDPNDLTSEVAPYFDNHAVNDPGGADPDGYDMWKNAPLYDSTKTDADNSEALSQKISFQYNNGTTYDVVVDEAANQTRVYVNGVYDASRSNLAGLSSEYVWIDGSVKVIDMQGPNKGNRVIAAHAIDLLVESGDQPAFRADVEPAVVDTEYGNQSFKPHTDTSTDRDGFTLATRDVFRVFNSGDPLQFAGNASWKYHFIYFNVLAHKEVALDVNPGANSTFLVSGSLYSTYQLKLYQSTNDKFKFAQDPSNVKLPGQTGELIYDVFHYEEEYNRAGS